MSVFGAICLAIFSIILSGSYITIRRGLLPFRSTAIVCASGTITALLGFGVAQELSMEHTLAMAFVVGGMFSGAMLTMAAFFQNNEPDKAELNQYLANKTEG